MAKKTARQLAKEKAWKQFSIFIRTRDCLRFTGTTSEGRCVTCMRWFPFNKLQAGHFISGRGNSVLFNEDIVYSQCGGCNLNPPRGKGGNYIEYFLFMEREWGRDKLDEFVALKYDTKVYKIHDFIELQAVYKAKTLKLIDKA